MKWLQGLLAVLLPPKCVLCGTLLSRQETDLCHKCRVETRAFQNSRKRIPFVAHWTALWYYERNVRSSLLRFKFQNRPSYAATYGAMLAMKLTQDFPEGFDILTWIPVSGPRRYKRGYDQVELIADAVSHELGQEKVQTLKKIRDNPAQSTIVGLSQRKANVLNVYKPVDSSHFAGKRVLLLDDIITTGATASEAARVLLTAGAKEVICAAVAAHPQER